MDGLLESFDRLLAALFPPARVRAIDAGAVWDVERAELEASGFLEALAPESAGGAGLPLAEVVPLWRAIGAHAAPLEIGEAMIARAGWGDAQAEPTHLLLLAAAMSGAADRVLAMTADYAGQRVQFGKPIGRQQAIQQQLAVVAEHCVAVRLAVDLAAEATPPDPLRTAAAKAHASASAPLIANTAHAVHGAIGISQEYDLQLFTGRLHTWRLAEGSEGRWHRALGRALLASDDTTLDWTRAHLFGEV